MVKIAELQNHKIYGEAYTGLENNRTADCPKCGKKIKGEVRNLRLHIQSHHKEDATEIW